MNKKSKDIWFCSAGSFAEKTNAALTFCRALKDFGDTMGMREIGEFISYFVGDFTSKLRANGTDESLVDMMNAVI